MLKFIFYYIRCSKLKWKTFDAKISQKFMVSGGNDSFGNRFYICRTFIDNLLIPGHMFQWICYVIHSGEELAFKDFQVLTHSMNDYEWQYMSSKRQQLPPNAIIGGEGNDGQTSKNKIKTNFIGRCLVKHFDYISTVIGRLNPNVDSVGVLRIPFNGLEILCNEFQVLLCKT